ncbi:hypothetical protein [Rhizobium rhizogenes]|uniref:hypothetical protein n=1 Tax=Rhizobium rhizogenes TaxID=359 RepID=UPI00124733AA
MTSAKLKKSKVWRPYFQPRLAPYGVHESDVRLSIEKTRELPEVDHASLQVSVGARKTYVQIDIHPNDFTEIARLLFQTNREAALIAFGTAILETTID